MGAYKLNVHIYVFGIFLLLKWCNRLTSNKNQFQLRDIVFKASLTVFTIERKYIQWLSHFLGYVRVEMSAASLVNTKKR